MQEIDAFEARNNFDSLLDRVERGEEIVIMRHGKPVARLVAVGAGLDRATSMVAAKRIRARAERSSFGQFDWTALKSDRDASRRT